VSGIEFLPDESAEPPPEAADEPGRHRPWWLLGVLALVAAAAAWTLTRPSTPSPRETQAAPTPITRPIGTSTASDPAAVACHGAPFCIASLEVPADLRTVIRQYLPSIDSVQVRSYVGRIVSSGGRYLTEREISLLDGSVNILISLHRSYHPQSRPSAIVTAAPGVGSVLVHDMTPAFTIDLQYLAPETVPPPLRQLRRLLRDPRLESL
jgi:hypothetical protein